MPAHGGRALSRTTPACGVFKVGGRMFALVTLIGEPASVTLKCDPDRALELRATYAAVRPGDNMSKHHFHQVAMVAGFRRPGARPPERQGRPRPRRR
ncbi:MAG: MmcQ/YjbR family DNA-binding protein [Acidimicrobiales bacterium]